MGDKQQCSVNSSESRNDMGKQLESNKKRLMRLCHEGLSMELERKFWNLDEEACNVLYRMCQENFALKAFLRIFSFSADESILFIFPVVVASIMAVYLGGPHALRCGQVSCDLELFLDFFGGMAICASMEQLLKCFFQRPRPTCRHYNNTYYCVYGEWYAFPSGHSMRSFYVTVWLTSSAHGGAVFNFVPYLEYLALIWAIGVAVSRVAAGRHHPSDTIVGAIVGLLLSRYVECELSDTDRALLKTVCGISVALQVWFFLLGPLIRDFISRSMMFAVAGFYFAFYLSALTSVVDVYLNHSEECDLGRISQISVDGVWQCKSWVLNTH